MRRLFSVMAAAAVLVAPAWAQQNRPPQDEQHLANRYLLAETYMSARQYARAIAVLEDLLAEDPHSLPVLESLKAAYVADGRLDEAIGLLRQSLAQQGPSPSLLAELGGLYLQRGDRAAAEEAFRQAVNAAPDHAPTYRVLYAVLIQHRLWEQARDILLAGRQRLGQPDLFRVELAELYSRSNQHAEALEEWAGLLAESPTRLSFVQGRIGRMLDQEAAGPAFQSALDRLIRREPTRLAYRRLAAWLAAEMGDFATGLNHVRALNRLARESGESLLQFAESALQAAAYDVAEEAFALVLELHPRGPAAPAALLSSALLHEKRAEQANERRRRHAGERQVPHHYGEAARRYEAFIERHPTSAALPVAMQRLAELKRDVFHDFARAEELLDAILNRFPGEDHGVEARFALGELAILRDDLTAARIAFTRLQNQLRVGEQAERARFQLALLDFYEGNFEMALSRLNAMQRNPATDKANDAIDLRLILTEHRGPGSLATPLHAFGRAELRLRQHRPDEALLELDLLAASHPDHGIAPLVRFRRAHALRLLNQPQDALDDLTALPENYPQSYLAERALFLAAEILERDLGDHARAIETYLSLLTRYPGSLLAPEARTRIRRLRADLQS